MEAQPNNGDSGQAPASTSVSLNLGFIKTPPGMLLAINIVVLFFGWVLIAAFNSDHYSYGRGDFFLVACLIPWIIFLVVFVLMMLNLHTRLAQIINFQATLMINCAFWCVFLFVASCLIAADSANKCYYKCSLLGASAFFGFVGCIGMGLQAFFHLREWRSP